MKQNTVIASVLIILLIACHLHQLDTLFRYDRILVTQGEWWRLITGNFTHSNLYHLALNIGGLLLVCILDKQLFKKSFTMTYFLVSLITVGLSVHYFAQVNVYRGLSGVLHGLFLIAAYNIRKEDKLLSVAFILLILVKALWEQLGEMESFTAELIQASITTQAHLAGVVTALALIGIQPLYKHSKARSLM